MRSLLLVLSPALALAFGQEDPPVLPDAGQGYEHVERFIKVLETVRANHPDGDKLSYERLVNHALEGMLESLDQFSAFYHPETYAYIQEKEGEPVLPGLGLTLGKSEDYLTVAAVRAGSPASRARIAPGDRILKIAERDTSGLSLMAALAALSGRPGESVTLGMRRKSDSENYEVSLLRSVVKQPAVPDAFLMEQSGANKVGYLRLTEFSASSHREAEAALDELEDQGMKSIILDLRGNPGGLLNISVAILGEFVPPSTAVVFTKGRNPANSSPPLKTPERKRKMRDYPMAVLIDRDSASASELVAGALQDLKRATVVGEVSFGKGSVQNIIPQAGGTALRLTIATYHTPSGRTPHEVGITPDLAVPITPNDREMLDLWRRRDALSPAESVTMKAWKDPVLGAALQALAK